MRYFNPGYDPWERCKSDTKSYGFYGEGTQWIFLCPSFSGLKPKPSINPKGPLDVYCPIVQGNVFVGNSGPLVGYQSYELLHLVSWELGVRRIRFVFRRSELRVRRMLIFMSYV